MKCSRTRRPFVSNLWRRLIITARLGQHSQEARTCWTERFRVAASFSSFIRIPAAENLQKEFRLCFQEMVCLKNVSELMEEEKRVQASFSWSFFLEPLYHISAQLPSGGEALASKMFSFYDARQRFTAGFVSADGMDVDRNVLMELSSCFPLIWSGFTRSIVTADPAPAWHI